jgi:hypothetical protein
MNRGISETVRKESVSSSRQGPLQTVPGLLFPPSLRMPDQGAFTDKKRLAHKVMKN